VIGSGIGVALETLLDLLFPPRCVGCGRRGAWLCDPCLAAVPRAPAPVTALGAEAGAGIASHAFAGALRVAIHRLKYKHSRHLARRLAGLLAADFPLLAAAGCPAPDLIVPVPLHPFRERQRGYNQSQLLAVALGGARRLEVSSSALTRLRDTPSQTQLSRTARARNVRDAFAADPRLVAGRHVLLIDDVTTTGATLAECARALRVAGATSVYALTVARAV
jgi:ComF family protein